MSPEGKGRVVVIGLDGATFDILSPLMNEGLLPNLAALRKEGSWGTLLSTIPPFTMPAWASFMTGMNPGKHGIISFFQRDPQDYEFEEVGTFINSTSLRQPTLWDHLSAAGKRMGVVNVPLTYPPHKINGFMITGMLTPSKASTYTYPPELAETLGDYIIDLDYLRGKQQFDLEGVPEGEALLSDIKSMLERRGETCLRLMARYDWDLFMVVFTSTDRVFHFFWPYLSQINHGPESLAIEEGLNAYFRLLDDLIGRLVARAGPLSTAIIMSDHGFGPAPTKRLNVNLWLESQGLLRVAGGKNIARLGYWRLKLSRYPWLKALWRGIVPSGLRQSVREGERGRMSQLVDWSATRAYAVPLYGYVCGVVINREGRKRQGIVPDEEYEALRESIIAKAREVLDPQTQRRVVRRAFRREEVYSGPYSSNFPDIILLLDPDYLGSPSLVESSFIAPIEAPLRSGDHRQEGIFIARGPSLRPGRLEDTLHLTQLAPTILYLLGVPIPRDMDGRLSPQLFVEGHWEANPPQYTLAPLDSISPSENAVDIEMEEIERRLRGLGYLG